MRPLTEEPSEEDLFWSTLLDLKDCSALDTADSAMSIEGLTHTRCSVKNS